MIKPDFIEGYLYVLHFKERTIAVQINSGIDTTEQDRIFIIFELSIKGTQIHYFQKDKMTWWWANIQQGAESIEEICLS